MPLTTPICEAVVIIPLFGIHIANFVDKLVVGMTYTSLPVINRPQSGRDRGQVVLCKS